MPAGKRISRYLLALATAAVLAMMPVACSMSSAPTPSPTSEQPEGISSSPSPVPTPTPAHTPTPVPIPAASATAPGLTPVPTFARLVTPTPTPLVIPVYELGEGPAVPDPGSTGWVALENTTSAQGILFTIEAIVVNDVGMQFVYSLRHEEPVEGTALVPEDIKVINDRGVESEVRKVSTLGILGGVSLGLIWLGYRTFEQGEAISLSFHTVAAQTASPTEQRISGDWQLQFAERSGPTGPQHALDILVLEHNSYIQDGLPYLSHPSEVALIIQLRKPETNVYMPFCFITAREGALMQVNAERYQSTIDGWATNPAAVISKQPSTPVVCTYS